MSRTTVSTQSKWRVGLGPLPHGRGSVKATANPQLCCFRGTACLAVSITLFCVTGAAAMEPTSAPTPDWPQWRGPTFNGVAPDANPPLEWNENKNIKWKVEIPGHGHSTPIVWEDRVYIQSAIPTGKTLEGAKGEEEEANEDDGDGGRRRGPRGTTPEEVLRYVLMALDRNTGKTVWQRTLRETLPHEGYHTDGSPAPASPLTDGKHIYAYFGSQGLYCLSMEGELVWQKDLGDMQTRNGFGEGSTPALAGDTLLVTWDHEGDSFIVALDAKTGEERWRKSRDEVTTWATPLVITHDSVTQAIVPGTNRVRSYETKTGKVVWECGGLGLNCIPTPVADDEMVYVMSGFRQPALLAIRLDKAKGDITDSDAVVWRMSGDTPYVPSPLLYDGRLYLYDRNSAILACYDAKSGKPHYTRKRIEDITGVYASPVGAGGRVYLFGRNGTAVVIKHGTSYEVLASNQLDESFSASPAIVGGEIFARGEKHLYCIASE